MKGRVQPRALVVLTLAAALLAVLTYMRFWPDPAVPEAVGPQGIVFGPTDAPLTVVAFLSPVCSHCQAFEQTSAPTLYAAAEAGRLRYVIYPVKTGNATDRDMASLMCAANQKAFPEFLEARFTDPRGALELAGELGLNEGAFERCLERPETGERAGLIGAWAKQLNVQATPTFYINDRADAQYRKVQGDKGAGFWEDVRAFVRESEQVNSGDAS